MRPTIRRVPVPAVLAVLVVLAACCALGAGGHVSAAAAADGSASWVSAPASPPPTPPGAQPSPYPVAIGPITDIEFWAPNRGLLMTAGNRLVPEGLYAYNGQTWHELSTVCGGTNGRIAWAGPDEFWTIADQRPGQVLPPSEDASTLQDISLCHFDDGQVVGSYAMLVNQPDSYAHMNAAACASADDCWFGGSQGFHLHWDGTAVSVVPDAQYQHDVASMALYDGQIFESLRLADTDTFVEADPTQEPVVLRLSAGSANPFLLAGLDSACGSFCQLPQYTGAPDESATVDPTTLGGLALSSDAGAAGVSVSAAQMWAVDGPSNSEPGSINGQSEQSANPVLLRYAFPDPSDPTTGPQWTQLSGVDLGTDVPAPGSEPMDSVAAEPGEAAAWLATEPAGGADNQAHVARVAVTGQFNTGPSLGADPSTTSATVTDEDVLGDAQGVGPRGNSSAIACPAAADCWVGTDQGWLFHLTDGTQLPVDTDPNFAGVITTRPTDGGVVTVQPAGVLTPTTVPAPPTIPPIKIPPTKRHKRAKPLVTHMSKARLVHKTTLELSFTLTARARVQLVATRKHKVVAETRLRVLKAGRHTLQLKLDRKRWPTGLALNAKQDKPTTSKKRSASAA